MKVLLLDTALPFASGSPRQRTAECLWRSLSVDAEVAHIAIDLWGTEWASRLQVTADHRLIGLPRGTPPRSTFLAQAGKHQPDSDARLDLYGEFEAAALSNQRRRQRLAEELARISPELVVVADPLLTPLAVLLSERGYNCRVAPNRAGAWHLSVAERLFGSVAGLWHRTLGEYLGRETMFIGEPAPDGRFQFDFDELYLQKSRSIVVPATGFHWLDMLMVESLKAATETMAIRQDSLPDICILGLPADLREKAPWALHYNDWQHLPGLAGAARAVYLPWLSPPLASLAEAALSLGTPVITTQEDAVLAGLAGRDGVLIQSGDEAARAMLLALDTEILGTAAYQRIRESSHAEATPPTASLRAARRVSPLSAPIVVRYNALSRMVLVSLTLKRGSGVEEVRLKSEDGRELNRLMPNAVEKLASVFLLEGAAIADLEEIGQFLIVEIHDALGLIETRSIPTDAFEWLDAEISAVEQDGAVLRGAFWATADHGAGAWGVGLEDQPCRVRAGAAVPMPEVGGLAIPFEVPVQPRAGQAVWISGRSGDANAIFDRVAQRPFVVGKHETSGTVPRSTSAERLRGIHQGQRAWVVGNGPSVTPEDLSQIPKSDVVFAFNRFYLSYGKHSLRETYVVSADMLMIDDFGQEMIDIACGLPIFVRPNSARQRLTGRHVILTPSDNSLPGFSLDIARSVSIGGSSVYVALQVAHYMGIREVFLYGIDYHFNMNLKRDPRYPFPVSFDDSNHFIESYRGAKPWCPPTWRDISAGFLNARVVYETTGGRIINATRGGRLETFARQDFDEILPDLTRAPPGASI